MTQQIQPAYTAPNVTPALTQDISMMILFTNNSPAAYCHSAVVDKPEMMNSGRTMLCPFPDTSFPEGGGQYCIGVTLLTSLQPWHTLLKGINMTLQRRQEICPADARRCLVYFSQNQASNRDHTPYSAAPGRHLTTRATTNYPRASPEPSTAYDRMEDVDGI